MKEVGDYLYKKVEIVCKDGKVFHGDVVSFGGSVQGEEEYGVADEYLTVFTGDADYVLFGSEIEEIKEV